MNREATFSPLTVVLKLLAIVFIAEAAVMFLLPLILSESVDAGIEAFVDSFLLTSVTAPLVWWVIIGPLNASAAAERMAAVARIATGVAHELRNPLTAIKMLVQTQREQSDVGGQLAEDLQVIEDEVRRLERSIQTFLDFARPRAPERQLIDPADIVHRTFALIKPRARNQRVELVVRAPDRPVSVLADAEQLLQLVLNLCLNALDEMPDGGTLTVSWAKTGDTWQLSVRDHGAGIDPHILRHLFQPFLTSKDTGVGIGLVICKRIAEAHQGRLRGENLADGACFTLELPTKV